MSRGDSRAGPGLAGLQEEPRGNRARTWASPLHPQCTPGSQVCHRYKGRGQVTCSLSGLPEHTTEGPVVKPQTHRNVSRLGRRHLLDAPKSGARPTSRTTRLPFRAQGPALGAGRGRCSPRVIAWPPHASRSPGRCPHHAPPRPPVCSTGLQPQRPKGARRPQDLDAPPLRPQQGGVALPQPHPGLSASPAPLTRSPGRISARSSGPLGRTTGSHGGAAGRPFISLSSVTEPPFWAKAIKILPSFYYDLVGAPD